MKYEVIRACIIRGERYGVGATIELENEIAKELMAIGRLIPHDEPAPAIEDRSVGLSEESAPKKRGRPKKVEPKDTEELEEPEEPSDG